ncbi:hypothetical protein NQ156_04490 [Microbacterium sp. zg.Y625]|uniref:hypothetical protein n=1 Tax=Microbacterium jiangjiandongii TaxID=3049071 RepID=UPI00214B2A5F|nr:MULTISPECIES: hypothetical protein [unclassified Microbacterium]MCR2792317.1 hypothetical protein [Microbacterium sp. zg.Y625]MCR2815106.1 hypothetical protein [Microbacterium sp. zg.Y843]WIM25112.1 hypothetical protein QNO14_13395 [Microbacterium sp. zg-Y625]
MSSPFFRTLLTAIIAAAVAVGVLFAASTWWAPLRAPWVLIVVGGIALVLGVMAGILGSYDLARLRGWLLLVIDNSWALPSTLLGAVVGNLVYPFFGTPSGVQSAGKEWVSYRARGTSGFGADVLQTIGTVNIGGAGNHERVHLLQARILGPLYLPIVGISYVVMTLLQCVWSLTIGLVLRLAGVRDTAWFRAPARSAVSGFWGWIYFATPMELWAYGTEP